MEALGCLGYIVVLIFGTALNGWALSVLWGWFIVPTFGASKLEIAPAIGLAMVVSFLTAKFQMQDEGGDAKRRLVTHSVFVIIHPLLALAIGWIVQLFM